MAGFVGWRVQLSFVLSFPLCGNGLLNHWIPRRPVPDAALPPASMQASLRWNDGFFWIPAFTGRLWASSARVSSAVLTPRRLVPNLPAAGKLE